MLPFEDYAFFFFFFFLEKQLFVSHLRHFKKCNFFLAPSLH